jgi:hypothetical protein
MMKLKEIRWEDHTARMGVTINAYTPLSVKFVSKRLLERAGRKMEYNIKGYRRKIGWKGVNWINLVEVRNC